MDTEVEFSIKWSKEPRPLASQIKTHTKEQGTWARAAHKHVQYVSGITNSNSFLVSAFIWSIGRGGGAAGLFCASDSTKMSSQVSALLWLAGSGWLVKCSLSGFTCWTAPSSPITGISPSSSDTKEYGLNCNVLHGSSRYKLLHESSFSFLPDGSWLCICLQWVDKIW